MKALRRHDARIDQQRAGNDALFSVFGLGSMALFLNAFFPFVAIGIGETGEDKVVVNRFLIFLGSRQCQSSASNFRCIC